ncbi:MAG: hypothetical protein D6785_12705 [Planctomycetota bacterium]|nr:MAG: hypothetical protein D6785_12705 [Planctomycetota bacterium]
MSDDRMEVKLPGYCYRVSQDVEVTLVKKKVRDELTLEETVKKEIFCNECEKCGLTPEGCDIVWGIINQHRGKKPS